MLGAAAGAQGGGESEASRDLVAPGLSAEGPAPLRCAVPLLRS
jgi:hypothetical protein